MARQGQADVYQKFVEPRLEEIREWYKTMTLRQIAESLGISHSTLDKYRKEHPELEKALTAGRSELANGLKMSIKKRGMGYYWTEVVQEEARDEETGEMVVVKKKTTTRHVPADLGCANALLKNIDPEWHEADKITIRQRERELKIKQQKADSAEW